MQNVFVSFSFREKDAPLVRPTVQILEKLLESFDMRAMSGEYLAGEPLTAAIKTRIEACSGFIALLTPDGRKRGDGKYPAHEWALGELNYARTKNIPAIALLHQDVENKGIFQDHEFAAWNPKNSLAAILKITQTVGQWKRTGGKLTKIKIVPEEVGIRVARNGGRCLYRNLREGIVTKWLEASVFGEVGGAFAHVSGVQDDALIELKVEVNGERWLSRATPQFLQVELQKE
jgi:hypothetical protein